MPNWLKSWWDSFGTDNDLCVISVSDGDEVIGIAPLLRKGKEACFIGDPDVCDYLDFVISPEREIDFFNTLMDYLRQKGVKILNLAPIKQESTVWTYLYSEMERDCGYEFVVDQADVLVEMDLPESWEAYLDLLSTKQRHEIKRKLKKITSTGNISYRVDDSVEAMNTFLGLFSKSKKDKAAFMTPKMAEFFRSLAQSMSEVDILKIGVLELDSSPVAAVMCFDYDGVVYIYNSAYDAQYRYLSVGLISKIMCIKDSIKRGKKSFNFLKGTEEYKYRLGGSEVPVYNCRIKL